jgi:hypothetical protein
MRLCLHHELNSPDNYQTEKYPQKFVAKNESRILYPI